MSAERPVPSQLSCFVRYNLLTLRGLAKYPNIAVKATGQAGYAEDAYPFRSLHPYLHRCFDAFGPEQMFLGHRHDADAMLLAAMRDPVHEGTAVVKGP
jgi:hypothetical protein